MPRQPGSMLGPYEILAPLGAGGMGEVYMCRDARLERKVALKLLPERLESPDAKRRFEQEARTIARLNHPKICTIHDIGYDDGVPYLVMEYLEGETLRLVLRNGPLSSATALEIGMQIAEGLMAAHENGIIHRDLKPDNIFLAANNCLKILDFGLARISGAMVQKDMSMSPTQVRTSPGTIIGTLSYMSPEQVRGEPADFPSDVFAFGVVLYEMLSGRRCFDRGTAAETFTAILRDEAEKLSVMGVTVPQAMESILERCLRKNTAERYASAKELLAALRSYTSGSNLPAQPQEHSYSIMVLPFRNLSPDIENEYFSDGLTEEVISDLSGIRAIRVISRISSMRLKGTDKDIPAIRRELNVQYVLEGSVRKAGNQIRVTARLVDALADAQLWSDKYNGTLDDIFEIQENISRTIVESLRLRLTKDEDRRLGEHPIGNIIAYDAYLRARGDIYSFNRERLDSAVTNLQKALEISPDNVVLIRGLGMAYWQYVNMGFSSDTSYLDRAQECAEKILKLDPHGAHASALLGFIESQRGNVRKWVRHLQRSLGLDPQDPDSLAFLSVGLLFAGQEEAAADVIRKLEAIDPLWYFVWWTKAYLDYVNQRYESAIRNLRNVLELEKENPAGPWQMAQVLAASGDHAGAIDIIDTGFPDPVSNSFATMAHILKHALQGNRVEAHKLVTPEFESAIWSDFQWTHCVAQSYAILNEQEESMRWLTRSVKRGFINYPFLSARDPLLVNLRLNHGFQALMEEARYQWQRFAEDISSEQG